jgi:hypothetical protein
MNNLRTALVLMIVLFSIVCFAHNLLADTVCVSMHHGKMMMMEDGKPTVPLKNSMTMSNGTVVMPDGTLRMKDGTLTHMKEGQMIMLDGHMMQGGKSSMGVGAN